MIEWVRVPASFYFLEVGDSSINMDQNQEYSKSLKFTVRNSTLYIQEKETFNHRAVWTWINQFKTLRSKDTKKIIYFLAFKFRRRITHIKTRATDRNHYGTSKITTTKKIPNLTIITIQAAHHLFRTVSNIDWILILE